MTLQTLAVYLGAAFAEIAGCFAVWGWMRLGVSALWLVPGILSLVAFAWLLTLAPSAFAGRAYAAYGGVYFAASLTWLGRSRDSGPTHGTLPARRSS